MRIKALRTLRLSMMALTLGSLVFTGGCREFIESLEGDLGLDLIPDDGFEKQPLTGASAYLYLRRDLSRESTPDTESIMTLMRWRAAPEGPMTAERLEALLVHSSLGEIRAALLPDHAAPQRVMGDVIPIEPAAIQIGAHSGWA